MTFGPSDLFGHDFHSTLQFVDDALATLKEEHGKLPDALAWYEVDFH